MTRPSSPRAGQDGFTLVEMMVTVCIIAILLSVFSVVVETVKARTRYGQIRGDMDGIAQAAYSDYSTNQIWAALSFGMMPTNWARNRELDKWPTPPCPGWYYSWEDWAPFGIPVTQVTLRRKDNTLLWGYCVDTGGGGGSCQVLDPFGYGSSATDLSAVTNHSIYCNE